MVDEQEELYETLQRRDITAKKLDRVASWPPAKLFELFQSVLDARRVVPSGEQSPFNFVANDSLSGASVPFASIEQRFGKATKLARFAALYADKLFIRDPFDRYPQPRALQDAEGNVTQAERELEPSDFDDSRLRSRLIDDIRLVLFLKPLFKAGLLGFAESALHWCPSCVRIAQDRGELGRLVREPEELAWQRRIAKVVKHLERTYLEQGTTLVHQHGGHAHASVFVPPGLFEYEEAQLKVQLPRGLAKKALEPLTLSLRDARSIRVFAREIDRIVDDLSTQNAAANRFGCQYITDRGIDIELMNLVSDKAARSFNTAAVDSLSHPLSFLDDIPLDRILKVREKEGEAFLVYRDAMRKLLATAGGKTAKELREAFDDEIRPELNRIDLAMSNARRIASVSTLTDAAVVFASVSIAAFSGLLPTTLGIPPELVGVGAALGGWQGAKGLASKLSSLRSPPKEVSDNRFAFLWRLRGRAPRRRR
jgi:hypothetical protein